MAPRPPTTTHATTPTNPLGHLHRDTPITARRTRGTRLAQHRQHPRLTINRGDDTVVVVAAVKATADRGVPNACPGARRPPRRQHGDQWTSASHHSRPHPDDVEHPARPKGAAERGLP